MITKRLMKVYIDDNWTKTTKAKGTKAYDGYLARDYYLELNGEIETTTIKATIQDDIENTFVQDIFENMTKDSEVLINDLGKKTEELITKLCELVKREEKIRLDETANSKKEARLRTKQIEVDKKEKQNYKDEYDLIKKIFLKAFCNKEFIIAMKEKIWNEQIDRLFEVGKEIGMSASEVKINACDDLVRIYFHLEMHEKAYDFLCIEAEHRSNIYESDVSKVLEKVIYRTTLREKIERRLQTKITEKHSIELKKCLELVNK